MEIGKLGLKEEGFVEKGSTSSAMVVAQKKTQKNHLLRQRYAQDQKLLSSLHRTIGKSSSFFKFANKCNNHMQ